MTIDIVLIILAIILSVIIITDEKQFEQIN
jgi:hypothetical protein